MAGKLPFMKWFTGDWLRAPDIRGLTPAARGIWFDLLNVMHEADRRGYLLVSGKIPTHDQLARMTGCSSEEFSRLLTEIVSSGVSSVTEEGIVFCRRMVAEESKRIKCTEAGKRGGNPALKGNGYPNAQPPPKGTVCTSESLVSSDLEILEVFKHYRKYHARALRNPQPASKEWKYAKARLSEGYSAADLSKAIDGCHKTPHNLGDNDRGEKYLDLELILRDSSHVERFMRNADEPPQPRGAQNREQARQSSSFDAISAATGFRVSPVSSGGPEAHDGLDGGSGQILVRSPRGLPSPGSQPGDHRSSSNEGKVP